MGMKEMWVKHRCALANTQYESHNAHVPLQRRARANERQMSLNAAR